MATNTPKYNFKKPDESDFYSIQDQNGNWDKAESTLVDLDAPTFEDYTGATQVPTPEAALAAINSKSKLSLLFSNIKAFLKGAVTIGMIVNNCATDNPNLPVSAAQAKALMDAVTKLNSELKIYALEAKPLGSVYDADNYYNNYSNLLPGCAWYRFVSSHAMLHPELGGGVLYVEGFKTDNEYEYQSACTYSQSGYKEYRRSKSAGSWGHWVAN